MLKQDETRQSVSLDDAENPSAAEPPEHTAIDPKALRERMKAQFTEQLATMRKEAARENNISVLADCMSLELAMCISHFGRGATAHILCRIGTYVQDLIDLDRAREEAEAASAEGHKTH